MHRLRPFIAGVILAILGMALRDRIPRITWLAAAQRDFSGPPVRLQPDEPVSPVPVQ